MADTCPYKKRCCLKQGCNIKLSEEQIKHCQERRILPLCKEHEEWFDKQLAKCTPLFQKLNL